jgi:putative DNA primase/helicase
VPRFEIAIEKGRGIYGDDARPIEARYEERDGAAIWMRTEICDAEVTRVADALNDGLSIRKAALKLGIDKSKVERLKKKASERGLLDD